MSTDLLTKVEQSITQAEQVIALAECLERLQNNRDFRRVMMDGFFKEEAIRLVHQKSLPEMQTDTAQKALLVQIDAIGVLYRYFQSIQTQAETARKTLESDEQTREELLAESLT